MKVRCDAGSSRLSYIEAHVEALRRIDLAQCRLAPFRQVHHFVGSLLIRLIQIADVLERDDHQMTGGVRINIENDKIKPGTLEDELFLVASRAI